MALFVLFYIGSLILLIVEIARYCKVKANAFTREEVVKAANKKADKMMALDPVITCDYCGYTIDTGKYKACPNCGGTYGYDPEWQARFDVDGKFVEDATASVIEERKKKADKESSRILRSIKRRIIIILVVSLLLLVAAIVAATVADRPNYRESEELNDTSIYLYDEADYELKGDEVIFEDGGVRITVTGFYDMGVTYQFPSGEGSVAQKNRVKVGFMIENNSDRDVRIDVRCNSINGISTSLYYFNVSGVFQKKKTVTVYELIDDCPGEEISEMIIESISVTDTDYHTIAGTSRPVVRTTTSSCGFTEADLSGYKQVYSDEKADIYVRLSDRQYFEGYEFCVINKTGVNYETDIDDMYIDDEKVLALGFYEGFIPAGYTLISSELNSTDDVFDINTIADKDVKVNITFKCDEYPSENFDTGYISLNEG